MNIDKKLLEKQITPLGNFLNMPLNEETKDHIEGLLNLLGDIADSPAPLEITFDNDFNYYPGATKL